MPKDHGNYIPSHATETLKFHFLILIPIFCQYILFYLSPLRISRKIAVYNKIHLYAIKLVYVYFLFTFYYIYLFTDIGFKPIDEIFY